MKTAIYIENGDTQLVLTPENEWEKNVITSINKGQESVKIFSGSCLLYTSPSPRD